jgi:hypothetical protein
LPAITARPLRRCISSSTPRLRCLAIDLGPGWDSGSSDTDHLTREAAPLLTGTTEAGATIFIKDGNATLGKVRADSDGFWSFKSPTLAEGAHTLTAHEVDAAGNKAACCDDLIVGASRNDDGGTDAGDAYILYGGVSGNLGTSIVLSGTSDAETLVGGNNADTLSGGGGFDVLIGGAGDDRLEVADSFFARIRGGAGTDTLAFSGTGMNVFLGTRVSSIERLDLGSGSNTATLSATDVLDLSTTKDPQFTAASLEDALVVLGDDSDVLNLDDALRGTAGSWSRSDSNVGLDGSAGGVYDLYEYIVSGHVRAFVAVDQDVTVHLV